MADKYSKGTKVKWKWGSGWGHGKVSEVFTEKVSRTIDGSEITRDASADEPAYLIETDDSRTLKSHSEVQKDG